MPKIYQQTPQKSNSKYPNDIEAMVDLIGIASSVVLSTQEKDNMKIQQ